MVKFSGTSQNGNVMQFPQNIVGSDKMIHKAFRTYTTLSTYPIRKRRRKKKKKKKNHFHYLPKLYIGFKS